MKQFTISYDTIVKNKCAVVIDARTEEEAIHIFYEHPDEAFENFDISDTEVLHTDAYIDIEEIETKNIN